MTVFSDAVIRSISGRKSDGYVPEPFGYSGEKFLSASEQSGVRIHGIYACAFACMMLGYAPFIPAPPGKGIQETAMSAALLNREAKVLVFGQLMEIFGGDDRIVF